MFFFRCETISTISAILDNTLPHSKNKNSTFMSFQSFSDHLIRHFGLNKWESGVNFMQFKTLVMGDY